MKKTSILGLGAMGARMAARLLQHGYPVVVYNRTPERTAPLREQGADVAATPREAAERADVVISMVRDDAAAQDVWLAEGTGAVHGLRPGAVAIESSTVTPAWARRLAAAVAARGASFLDAPVVGTRPHAESGQLIYLAGGEGAVLDQVRPMLDVLGGAVHPVGPVGAGAVMKLAVNALFAVQAVALAELLAMLTASGLEPAAAVGVLNALPTSSPAAARVATRIVERAYAPNFPIHLVAKDLGYASSVAREAGVGATVVEAALSAFEEAQRRGYGGDDIVGVAQGYPIGAAHGAG
ncbi:hypothetical protein AWN76_005410 [Rhodothermaceae bacterium RA]|nr:hypothetical protein AWN76_005410 [Rhodothermaceae bacterium RA]